MLAFGGWAFLAYSFCQRERLVLEKTYIPTRVPRRFSLQFKIKQNPFDYFDRRNESSFEIFRAWTRSIARRGIARWWRSLSRVIFYDVVVNSVHRGYEYDRNAPPTRYLSCDSTRTRKPLRDRKSHVFVRSILCIA